MFEIYNVLKGDTIDSVADNYRVSSDYLFKINGLIDNRNIKAGDNIIVPKFVNNYFDYYTIENGIKLNEFASDKNIDEYLLCNLNGLNNNDYLYPNQIILIPKNDVSYYITGDNDSINKVSNIMGINIMELINQNNNILLKDGQFIIYKEK